MGRGRESDWLDPRGNRRPKKTGETVDRRQNNGSVKAVSPRHCPATFDLAWNPGLKGRVFYTLKNTAPVAQNFE